MQVNRLSGGRSGWAVALIALALLLAVPAAAPAAEDPVVGAMYSPDAVVAIDLELAAPAIEDLEDAPEELKWVKGTFSFATTDGTPDGIGPFSTPVNAEVRLKGNVGASFRPIDGKAAFKLKFAKTETFHGLRKMTLNNMVQDPSLIHERLTYQVFRDAGLPGPRTGYAFVSVNGEPFGIYLNLENYDDISLEKIFSAPFDDPQHLYEAEYGDDVYPGQEVDFEVDEGEEGDRGDLEALIEAVNSTSGSFSERVAAHADLAQMTRMWAAEKFTGHWDGYAGEEYEPGQNEHRPNNYYLYSDPLGRFQMLPTGTDQTWWIRVPFDSRAGLMFDLCLEEATCLAMYREAVGELLAQFDGAEYDEVALEAAELIQPWQAIDPRRPHDEEEFESWVDGARYFSWEMRERAVDWLTGTPPEEDDPESDQPPPPSAAPPLGPPAPPAPTGRLRVNRVELVGRVLRIHLRVPGQGVVLQRVTIPGRRGPTTICHDRTGAARAKSMTVNCPLGRGVRKRLEDESIKATLKTRFAPPAGKAQIVTRRFTLPQR